MFGILMSAVGMAGSGLEGFSQWMVGEQQNDQARYNARLMIQRAESTRQMAQEETRIMREDGRRFMGQQTAALAKSGAQISSGTPLLVAVEQAGEIERDILQRRRTRLVEEQKYISQAEMLKVQGRAARSGSRIKAVTTLLSGGAKVGSIASRGFGGMASNAGAASNRFSLQGFDYSHGYAVPDYQNPKYMSPRR